jgi:hypothetical protein
MTYDGIERSADITDGSAREEVRREFGVSDDTTLVGMIARVDEAKDYETLAKAARRLLDVGANVHFLIVGGYSVEKSQVKHFARVKEWLAGERRHRSHSLSHDYPARRPTADSGHGHRGAQHALRGPPLGLARSNGRGQNRSSPPRSMGSLNS